MPRWKGAGRVREARGVPRLLDDGCLGNLNSAPWVMSQVPQASGWLGQFASEWKAKALVQD